MLERTNKSGKKQRFANYEISGENWCRKFRVFIPKYGVLKFWLKYFSMVLFWSRCCCYIGLVQNWFRINQLSAMHTCILFFTWGGLVEHLCLTKVAQQSVTNILSHTFANLVKAKVGAKHELLFNKPASEVGLLSIQVWLKKHNKVWPTSYLPHLKIWSKLKLELSMSFCSTNWPLRLSIHVRLT